jgi:hypothetical protein
MRSATPVTLLPTLFVLSPVSIIPQAFGCSPVSLLSFIGAFSCLYVPPPPCCFSPVSLPLIGAISCLYVPPACCCACRSCVFGASPLALCIFSKFPQHAPLVSLLPTLFMLSPVSILLTTCMLLLLLSLCLLTSWEISHAKPTCTTTSLGKALSAPPLSQPYLNQCSWQWTSCAACPDDRLARPLWQPCPR